MLFIMPTSSRMSFPSVATAAILSTIVLMGMSLSPVRAGDGPYAAYTWTDSHATFYGGDDASGTMGGACGYGNLNQKGYGVHTTALSQTLFNGGLTCGACFEIRCILSQSRWCYANGGSVTVTATNLCPPNWSKPSNAGGWCNPPRTHFDLAYPMFAQLAQKVGGIIPVEYRRVSCVKKDGIRFLTNGNPWFNLVLVYNVAGPGNVVSMEMKGSKTNYYSMTQNWGQNWELKQKLTGQAITFRVTVSSGAKLVAANVASSNWQFGQTFADSSNFSS